MKENFKVILVLIQFRIKLFFLSILFYAMIFRLTKDTVYHLLEGEIFLIKLTLDYAYLSL